MNIPLILFLGSWNILYNIYEMLIYTGVSIIYIQTPGDERDITSKNVINICNNYCKEVSYDIGWKFAEIATVTKIFYRKTIIPYFHELTNDYFRYPILLIKDGEELIYVKNIDSSQLEEMEYDLLFYTDYNENDPKKNYTIISESGIKDIKSPIEHKCDINFIIFQLNIDNEKFDINLKEPKNFLLKNNILKYNFFKWYMKKVYNKDLSGDFSVNYMCQDMSTENLNSPFFIKFGDEGVTSFSSKKPTRFQTPELSIEVESDNDEFCGEGRRDIKEDSDNESELSNTDEENNEEKPTFCSHTCVLKARQNLNKEKEESKKKDDDSFEHIEEISENTFDVDFSTNLLSSIVKTEQQKLHQE